MAIVAATALTSSGSAQETVARSERMTSALDSAREHLISIRRDIHRHPELSGEEERTSTLVAERLRSLEEELEE